MASRLNKATKRGGGGLLARRHAAYVVITDKGLV